MKNMLKKVCLFTTLMVSVFGATSAIAQEVPVINIYVPYSISSKANTGLAIDIPFSDITNKPNLFAKDLSKGNQRWMLGRCNSYVWVYANQTVAKPGIAQMVMAYSYVDGCVKLLPEVEATAYNSSIDFHNLGSSYYRMYFPNMGKYVGVDSATPWANLKALPYSEASNKQKWYVEK